MSTKLLAAQAPKLRAALRKAKREGMAYVIINETLIPIRPHRRGPPVLLRQAPNARHESAGRRLPGRHDPLGIRTWSLSSTAAVCGGEAGDDECVFLSGFLTVEAVGSSSDASSLFRVWKMSAVGVRAPSSRFPDVDAAMLSFTNSVVGCVLDKWNCLGCDSVVKRGLVSLAVKIESPGSGDVLGGVMLGVRGIHRDDHAFSLAGHGAEQGFHLGDLVGVRWHLDLGDGDAFAVDHRGEQREPLVFVGPD